LGRNTRKQEVGSRDGWRFLCNIQPYLWKLLKSDDDDKYKNLMVTALSLLNCSLGHFRTGYSEVYISEHYA
jgi:hypothetical protein